ncbi:MAG TPA: exodeoxyribonuclease VII large subunit [Gemmatimonadales bacterium]
MIDGALSVSEVSARLKGAVEGALGQVWIKGELAELKVYASGHWYFTLRDRDCQVKCVMWRTYAQQIRARPPEGAEVFVRARPDFWQERGEVRLSAVALLRTEGVGDAERALRQARESLGRDGLLDPLRKRPLPPFPMRVAIVTSIEGAALHDMVTVARRRWPAKLLVVGSAVQGEAAERELVRALTLVNRLRADLCIVGRGGGSREDLAAFNLESVCRAIAAVRVPVISAVGHQTDVTLADLVADRRAETPSAAVEMALPDRGDLQAGLVAQGTRLAGGLRRRTRLAEERLYRAEDRMRHVIERRVAGARERLGRLGAQLDALSPLRVLGRGYAVPQDEAGRVLRRMGDFPAGLPFRLRVADGVVGARVEGT